jgi:hypothetical protein
VNRQKIKDLLLQKGMVDAVIDQLPPGCDSLHGVREMIKDERLVVVELSKFMSETIPMEAEGGSAESGLEGNNSKFSEMKFGTV